MEEYRQWLEQQIERCLNDKDLQREHWAFCKAYEKFTALRKHPLPSDEKIWEVFEKAYNKRRSKQIEDHYEVNKKQVIEIIKILFKQ